MLLVTGYKLIDVLTGFKFIAEKIGQYHETGEHQFLFGYEESYGYLIKDFARDKDAIQSVVLATEVCAYYKQQGMTLYEGLLEVYEKYGFYLEGLQSLTLKGIDGARQIQGILNEFRENPPKEIAGNHVVVQEDYQSSQKLLLLKNEQISINLPKSNVLKYFLEDGTWVCLRPSGTEPKIKFYFGVQGETMKETKDKLSIVMEDFMSRIQQLI